MLGVTVSWAAASGLVPWWPEKVGDAIGTAGFVWVLIATAAFLISGVFLDGVGLLGNWNPKRLPAVNAGA